MSAPTAEPAGALGSHPHPGRAPRPRSEPLATTAPPWRVSWGDLHSHSNLSADGCEDAVDCGAIGELPGDPALLDLAEAGQSFVAFTEHAEYDVWARSDTGVELDIWQETIDRVRGLAEGELLGIVGFEWTLLSGDAGHRTVILEEDAPCPAWRVSSNERSDRLGVDKLQTWSSSAEVATKAIDPGELAAAFEAARAACGGERVLSWYHHPAIARPKDVDWAVLSPDTLGDTVVEIASEHGSSECADPEDEGCDWHYRGSDVYAPTGSVQAALAAGWRLGFVGGTDSHDARSGSLTDGPGHVSAVTGVAQHWYGGTVTGVLWQGEVLTRSAIFDAIEARHTLVTSWPLQRFAVLLVDSAGVSWLPGDVLPAGDYRLELALEAPDLEWVGFELVDPLSGELQELGEGPALSADVQLSAGEIRYLRARLLTAQGEERAWASPWFAE